MSRKSKTPTVGLTALIDSIPSDVLKLLGPPPLLSTEDANLYYAMLASIAQSIRPGDCITWLLIKDLADHRVEVARYRRFKTGFIQAAVNKRKCAQLSHWRNVAKKVAVEVEISAEQDKRVVATYKKTAAEI